MCVSCVEVRINRERVWIMKTLKSTMRTEVLMNDDNSHKYVIRKDWSIKGKEKVMTVIMIQFSNSDIIQLDMTTLYVINNAHQLGYNVVNIVNIFSGIEKEYDTDKTNDEHILKTIKESEIVVWGVGNAGKYNKVIQARVDEVIKLIEKHQEKIYVLTDGKTNIPRHPLSPHVRLEWHLKNNISLN